MFNYVQKFLETKRLYPFLDNRRLKLPIAEKQSVTKINHK